MYMGVELVAETAVFYDDSSFVSMHLVTDGREVPGSAGVDDFLCNGAILPGKRVAATGRRHSFVYDRFSGSLGLGVVEATPCLMVPVPWPGNGSTLRLRIRNNIVLDPGLLCANFSLKVKAQNGELKEWDIPLSRPDVRVDWPARGEFEVNLGDLLAVGP